MTTMTFTKVASGWWATADGKFAAIRDDFQPPPVGPERDQSEADGFGFDGWVLAHDARGRLREDNNAGENLDWFDTKREAVAAAGRRA